MKRTIVLIAVISLLFTSCEKLDENYNKIPDDAARMEDLQREYQEILVANPDGWFMEYQPGTGNPSVPILMKFAENGTVSIVSDRQGFEVEKVSTYRIGGVIGPELIFDTYSVFASIAESGGGVFDFRMYPQENGDFILKHATGGLENEFTLRKSQPDDQDNIEERAAVGSLLKDFDQNATAYFKNLSLTNISAFWEINVETQQVTLTWETTAGGTTSTQTFGYTTLPGMGIRLAQPWVAPEGIEVQEIFFGDATPSGIAVVSAGNAGTGEIQTSHIPAFPYKGTAEKYIFSNLYKENETTVRLLAYTSNSESISEALRPYYDAVTNALPSFWRIQVYNYSPVTAPRNAIVLVGKDAANSNTFHYFYYGMTKVDDSHVGLLYEDANALGQTIENHPDVKAFLDKIYPPEGVTIIPYASQRIRVVSRANSLHYMDLIVSTPTGIWNN